ncbi:MAG: hypothetical protein EB039_13645 [Proteobacteria bacterium]|nr:hypothetical protein [Pseudomonadota bacterium]
MNTWATGLLAVVGTLITGVALADGPEPSANPAGEQLVKIRSQSFENRRFGDETMTWVVQKSLYEDGLTVLTLAGLQFEESFGLTVALLDDVVPTNVETSAQKNGENPAQLPTNKTIEDGFRNPDNEISGNPPRLQLKVRSLLVDVGELKEKPILRQTVPLCENGQRRAIVYLRAAQLGRQLDLSASDAQKLSRLARAACVRWEGVPATSNAAEKDSKIPAQIDARSQPGAADPKN